jgi:hypothetical protein
MADYSNGGDYLNRIMDPEEFNRPVAAPPQQPGGVMDGMLAGAEPGGITGGSTGNFTTTPSNNDTSQPPTTTDTPPAYSKVAPSGWDQAKWDDPNHKSAKYVMRKTLDPFDAKAGFTPKVIAALNKLGYGNFSAAGGDGLNLSGLTAAGRAAGLSGDYKGADFINKFKAQNGDTSWGYSDPVAEAASAQSGGGGNAGPSAMAMMLNRRYAGMPDQMPDNQFMNGSLENPVQFGSNPLYTQNPFYQEMMKRLLFTPKQ